MRLNLLKRQSFNMRLLFRITVILSFQITFLQAYCSSLKEASTERAATIEYQSLNGNTNDKPVQESKPARGLNETQANEIDIFRLEFNKYKILSHLSITSNLDDIKPRIDEGLRYKLLTSTAIKETMTSSETGSNSRRRRSLTCDQVKNEKSACCLDNFYVNFTHIGWDKWILYPPGYKANYCRGKCDLSHARYYHSTLLSKYSHVVSLCCSPKQMAPLNLLYIDEENKVHQKSIPDMVVESCDCA